MTVRWHSYGRRSRPIISTLSCPNAAAVSFTAPCWQPLSQHVISCMDPGQLCEIWLDPQGRTSEKMASVCRQEDWGKGTICVTYFAWKVRACRRNAVVAGIIRHYYAAIRDALNGDGENSLPAAQVR